MKTLSSWTKHRIFEVFGSQQSHSPHLNGHSPHVSSGMLQRALKVLKLGSCYRLKKVSTCLLKILSWLEKNFLREKVRRRRSRYIEVKVGHFLLFMFSPPEISSTI